jgi:hypothetical protein
VAIVLSTNILTPILEFTDFSRTVNVIRTDPMFDPPITSIEVTKEFDPILFFGALDIITDNSSFFTLSGKYSNNFIDSLKYLDENKNEQVIKSKSPYLQTAILDNPNTNPISVQLPKNYFMIVEYLASTESSFIAKYKVNVNGSFLSYVTQIVNNNYTVGRDALIAAVTQGKV